MGAEEGADALGTEGLQALALAFLAFGPLTFQFEGAPARIKLVPRQGIRAHDLGKQATCLGGLRRGFLRLAGSAANAVSSVSAPGPEIVRFFFFSTTTDFERP